MALRDQVVHQAALAGRVIEAVVGRAILGARVQLTTAPDGFNQLLVLKQKQIGVAWDAMAIRPDRTVSAPDGHFHFLDLPDGDYTVAALLPGAGSRWGSAQVNARVKRDNSGNLQPVIVELAVPATSLQGKVTNQNGGAPIAMAAIRILGSGETVYASADGSFRIAALESGKRTISASAPGFQAASQDVTFANPGDGKILNFTLTAA